MDEQFEKTENSMSIYYTVNKMLIALHMALLVFFVVMRVYVMAAFCGVGNAGKAQLFIDVGGKYGALQRAGHHRGGQEQSLIEGGHQTQVCADLLPQTGGGQPVSAPLHALLGAADVAADGGQAAPGILNEAPHDHVCSQV